MDPAPEYFKIEFYFETNFSGFSKLTPYYKRMVDAHNDIADIADECVKEYMEHKTEAMENKAETRGNSEETVLGKKSFLENITESYII